MYYTAIVIVSTTYCNGKQRKLLRSASLWHPSEALHQTFSRSCYGYDGGDFPATITKLPLYIVQPKARVRAILLRVTSKGRVLLLTNPGYQFGQAGCSCLGRGTPLPSDSSIHHQNFPKHFPLPFPPLATQPLVFQFLKAMNRWGADPYS